MTARLAPLTLLAATALAVTLSGCSTIAPPALPGGTTDSEAPDFSVDAADGELITGDGYSYRVPEGWATPEEPTPGFSPDTFAADLTDDDGFADNVNVLLSGGVATPDQVEQFGTTELENAGAVEVAVQPRVTIAGAESAHLTASLTSDGVAYWIEQYYPTNDGETYVVTFSFSDALGDTDRVAIAESVLASWEWV